jgi:amino acid adenylation domain-containing protein
VRIGKVPLTLNGKVNEAALPEPWGEQTTAAASGARELTETEQVLAGVWSQVLGVNQAGADDNFFSLGGHSLLATLIVIRIHETFGVEIPLRKIFEAPTVVELAAVVDAAVRAGHGLISPPITTAARPGALPLSFAQQRLWFLDRLMPGTAAYNVPVAYQLAGSIDAAALERSINQIVARHEVLRTTISLAAGEPAQIVGPEVRLKLEVSDLRSVLAAERQEILRREVEHEEQLPFDLSTGPVIRARLLRVADAEHVLVVTLHHIVSDGWSMDVFGRELSAFYAAQVSGEQARLPELPVQYADFAVWQREWLQGEVLDEQLSYWREQLQGATGVLELPTDKTRPKVAGGPGAIERFEIAEEVLTGLRGLARDEGATLFMTLWAGFSVLLSRYTGQQDLLVGAPVANRGKPEVEGLIGFFSNTLVLRARVTGEETFRTLLDRAREVCLGAYAHQDLPFEALVEELQPARDVSRTPLFQVTFAVQNSGGKALELSGLKTTPLAVDTLTSKFELTVVLGEKDGKLLGAIQYNTDLFDAQTVARLASHFVVLLEHVVENPDSSVSSLPLLTRVETEQALVDWNQTEVEYQTQKSAHHLFEEQVARTPDALALVWHDQRLSYRELNHRADQLARYLRKQGVGAEKFVGVCLERSAESAVSVLGVLKAGGACLLLDPRAGKDELEFSLEEVRPQLLLTQERLARDLSEWRDRILRVDSQWTDVEREVPGDSESKVAPESLAYLLGSRGSDGNFRAITHTHEALSNGLLWMQHAFRLSDLDRVLHNASAGSEVGLWELLSPLLVGATVVIAQPGQETNCAYLARLVCEHDVTTAHFAPSLLENFVDEVGACGSLRRVLCSGEPLSRDLRERFDERLGGELHYLYTPQELAVGAAHWACGRDDGGVAPAGRPIANTQMYVLDASMQPVPVGVEGHLYIGGAGVARGYLNSPDITAERFIPDPFNGRAGSRLAQTGEVGRYRADGAIEHSGRAGRRLKVKGYELELLDVEAQIRLCPGVSRAAVVATDHALKGKRLIAYIVPVRGFASGDALVSAVRTFLRERLPDYALPSAYISLAALPLRADGRLDRFTLPKPDSERPETESAFVPPATATEHTIAAVWQEYLGIESVGLNDNFFDLGGHSLLLAQLHIKLSELFGDSLSVIDLFRYPTVSALAQYLNELQPNRTDRSAATSPQETPRPVPVEEEPLQTTADLPANAVAIIGMSARLPGCRDVAEFWEKLKDGVELISSFSDQELAQAGVSAQLMNDANYVKASAFLDDPDLFDAAFFGIQPREAEAMDPQQRQFLECAWAALEDAGYDSDQYDGRIGVYAGVGMNTYLPIVVSNPELMQAVGGFQVMLANDKDFLPTRVSYKLNLRGPSVAVQTACSTSLVAVHLACRSLLDDECDIALCGGVTVRGTRAGYLYQEGGITSPDGHCRAFDSRAAGTVPGNGVGIVVLKRLRDALTDGDRIDAVILGSAINNDGSLKVGFTAPSIEGQAEVIAQAQSKAGVTPDTITYVEAHGTGTALGDPIEVAALTQAFRLATQKKSYCALGSLKTNFGHLDAAAGVCGLIKAVLALKHKTLPPSLHYESANPKIDFPATPFFVNTTLKKWETNGAPRRAGVSSFGIGGTNAHVVLEEAPESQPRPAADETQLILLTARTEPALEAMTANLRGHLQNHPDLNLRDLAYTLQVGRRSFEYRRALVARHRDDAIEALDQRDDRRVVTKAQKLRQRPCVFAFPGQGAQYLNMGKGLYESAPTFRQHVDECCDLLKRYTGADLREILYPSTAATDDARRMDQTVNAQPALFAIEYALTRFWAELGVKPSAMLGHSVGEYVAACVAGVFSLEDALLLVARRAELMQSLPPGKMLVVPLPEREVELVLRAELSLAAVNGMELCVVSGPAGAVEDLERQLGEREIDCHTLHTSHAFHSAMVEPIVKPFVDLVKEVELKAPRIPYISNLTGSWITVSEAIDPNYWGDHLRRTVRFSDGLNKLLVDRRTVVLEMGPGTGLSGLIKKHPARAAEQEVLATMRSPKDGRADFDFLLQTLGAVWLAGARVDWSGLHSGKSPRRIQLPTYPFQRKRYWVDRPVLKGAQETEHAKSETNGHAAPTQQAAMAAHAPAMVVQVRQAELVKNVETHDDDPPHSNGYGTAPTPTQQIIARQLQISSEQVRLMALQLELLRNAKLGG